MPATFVDHPLPRGTGGTLTTAQVPGTAVTPPPPPTPCDPPPGSNPPTPPPPHVLKHALAWGITFGVAKRAKLFSEETSSLSLCLKQRGIRSPVQWQTVLQLPTSDRPLRTSLSGNDCW